MSALIVEPLSQVRAHPVRWLWQPYVPRGKLVVLDGDPGVGKSLVTIDLAARLSRGGELPGNSIAERPHFTLLLSAEDGAADTTRPRAEAAGADLDRVAVVSAASGHDLSLPARLPDLEALITSCHADLVVIDPVMAFLPPDVAANLDQCVRRALTPLAALAERTDCAILLVRHLRKSATRAVHRGLGSVGILGAARTGLLAAKHPTEPNLHVLAVTKSNVTGTVSSLGYRVKGETAGQAVVEWVGAAELSADALGRNPDAPLRPRERAIDWLRAELASGPRRVSELYAVAGEASIPERTLSRAKCDLGVVARKVTQNDRTEWYWYDPAAPWPSDAPFKKPILRELPPLDELF